MYYFTVLTYIISTYLRLEALDKNSAELNNEQTTAVECLRNVVRQNEFSVSLIDGVTGSGKTEVYFEVIAEVLKKGFQVLILVPEIALARPFIERFSRRFGAALFVLFLAVKNSLPVHL